MGASYLSRPKKVKESEDRQNKKLAYGVSSMQGWRIKQEDAHNCILDFDEETALFGVYDGHGGAEVAVYTSEKLPGFIKDNEEYKAGDCEKALISAFLAFDDTLTTKSAISRLNEIIQNDREDEPDEREESKASTVLFERPQCSHSSKDADDDDDDDEYADVDPETETPDSLRRDASRPLEEVMASYRIPNVSKLIAGERGMKPASPYLRGRRDGAGGSGDCSSSSAGECSSSFVQPGPSSSNECSSSTSHSQLDKGEVNGSGDAEAESSVNGEPKQSSSKAILKEQSEEISESSKSSKEESSTNGISESLVNGSANVNGDVTEEVGTSTKAIPAEESPTKSDENPSCSTPSKKKKLALTDLDDSDVVKNFITNDEIDENDEDDSEDETFEVDDGGDSDSEDEEFEYPESILNQLKRRLCQVAMQAESIDDDDDDDDDDDNHGTSAELDEEGEEEESEAEGEGVEEESEDDDSDDESIDLFSDGSNNPGAESGCTAVVALIKDNNLYVANAGDSRCVICKDGKAVDMSEDHKPEDELERSRIEKAGGEVTTDGRVNGGLNLSRAIGDHDYKRNAELSNKEQMIIALPDVRVCKLESDVEFIVLACDGIWNSMSSQEVIDFVKPKIQANQKLSTICEELFDACLAPNTKGDGTGCDNMTCIIVKIRKDGDNNETTVEAESKQTTTSENIKVDSKEAAVSETVEADSKQADVSEKIEVDSVSLEQLETADSSSNDKDDKNNEAVPSEKSSEAEPVSQTEQESSSTRLKRCADSTEEEECQAKRQKTDTNVDSS